MIERALLLVALYALAYYHNPNIGYTIGRTTVQMVYYARQQLCPQKRKPMRMPMPSVAASVLTPINRKEE